MFSRLIGILNWWTESRGAGTLGGWWYDIHETYERHEGACWGLILDSRLGRRCVYICGCGGSLQGGAMKSAAHAVLVVEFGKKVNQFGNNLIFLIILPKWINDKVRLKLW